LHRSAGVRGLLHAAATLVSAEVRMDGSISRVRISDGKFRYRARYRDPSGRQHERRFPRKVDAQRWLDETTSTSVTRTWTAPERGRVTVAEWAERWLAAQTGIKPSTQYRYATLLRAHVLPAWSKPPAD
jgi:hypothetical protein